MAKQKRVAREGGNAGIPADAAGNPAIDPTANVIALVDLNVKHLDAMREREAYWTERVALLREEKAELRAKCNDEIRAAEAARIDANRATDLAAVASAAAVQRTQADTLATTVATSAETLRTTVAATATVTANALVTGLTPLMDRITVLERDRYQQQGQRTGAVEQTSDAAALAEVLRPIVNQGAQTARLLEELVSRQAGATEQTTQRRERSALTFTQVMAIVGFIAVLVFGAIGAIATLQP